MATRTRRPTQSDIARAAGVSPAVVSLVINDRADGKIKISAETQRRVREAIRTLGYVPNMAARQLAGGRNHLLGVFTWEAAFPLAQNNFYYPFLVGIEEQAEALGFDLLLFTRSADGTGRRQVYRDGVNALQAADGAVLLGTNEDRGELARLAADGFPFVFVGRREIEGKPYGGEIAWVGADYTSATDALVRSLFEHGHRELLYLGGSVHNESSVDRQRGFDRALASIDQVPDPQRIIPFTTASVNESFLRSWLEAGITAIVCEGLWIAYAIQDVARAIGLEVPRDFSLVALGNSGENLVEEDTSNVSSFLIPRREMGASAVDLLARMLYRPTEVATSQILLPCSPVPGATIGAPPA